MCSLWCSQRKEYEILLRKKIISIFAAGNLHLLPMKHILRQTMRFSLRIALGFLPFLILMACGNTAKTYHVGVSQCSEDIWRYEQNKELEIGSYLFDNIKLEITSADDNDEKQIQQLQEFIDKKVDLLIVAPNSATQLTSVVDKAYDSGIPVIFFDRHTNSEKYTAYMGGDNYNIGHTMGLLIARQMKGQGTLVEITGLKGSSSAIERHRGFGDALKNYPQIQVISSELGNWTEQSGEKAMEDVLRRYNGEIDCVFGHNDRLAVGARKVAMAHGLQHIIYYGVDALPTPGGGIELVQKGVLKASYIYPTQGVELMRLAKKILDGEKFERTNLLQSAVVDASNADVLQLQYKELQRRSAVLDTTHAKLDMYFSQVNLQQKIIVACIIVIIIIIALAVMAYRFYLTKVMVNEEVVKEIMDAVPQTPMASTPLAVLEEEHTEARGSFLDRFRTILQQNLHDSELNVERIGEKMGMSRVQLYRKVKSLTGMTPVELLRKYRLSRGRQLLETTDLSISEIAYDVGFTAPSYFAKCFKDEFGISPGEVRQAKEK